VWFNVAGASGLLVLGGLIAPAARRTGCRTLPELVGVLYDDPYLRRLASVTSVLAAVAWLALLSLASAQVLTAALPGLDASVALVLLVLVMLVYTAMGGQRAVADSDVVQLGILIGAILLVALPLALSRAGGLAALPRESLSLPFSTTLGPSTVLTWLLLYGIPHAIGPDVQSKILSARDERTARRSCIVAAMLKALFGVGIVLLVLSARSLGVASAQGTTGTLPAILTELFPGGLGAVLSLALLAVLMSSWDSVALTASAIVANDLLPARSDRSRLLAARLSAVVLAGAGCLVALASRRDLVSFFELGYTLFAAGLGPVILLGFWRGRIGLGRVTARWAVLGGGGVGVILTLLERPQGVEPVVAGVLVGFAILVGGGIRTRLVR
jgi:SSS family solute:Na+ symporter